MTMILPARVPLLAAVTLGWLGAASLAAVTSFDDIRFWIGTGPHRAALVVDWLGTPELPPLAWGYRWSGSATGERMFRDIVQADPRLFAKLGTPGPFGVPLFGIGYDRDGDGFALSDGTTFMDGIAITEPSDGAVSSDPHDSYNEGWDTGFWSYYTGAGNPYGGGNWQGATTGFSDRLLSDGDWDGFSFAPDFVGEPPALANAALAAVNGDFNRDERWDCADIDALTAAIAGGSTDLSYDMNGDGGIGLGDITDATAGWLAVAGARNPAQTGGRAFLPGDADLSGGVDGSDFGIWNSHKFSLVAAWCQGDFNAGGGVDGSDFGIWNNHKFQSSGAGLTVPEAPGLLGLLALALTAFGRRVRTALPPP